MLLLFEQQEPSKSQVFCGMYRILNGFKILFFPMENSFFPIHFYWWWILKIQGNWLFHPWSLKCDQPHFIFVIRNIEFFNSSLNSKLGFLNVGLRFFPNSQKSWKLGFVSVSLVEIHKFSQFMKVMEYWNFWLLA